jgi:hypothetical protein
VSNYHLLNVINILHPRWRDRVILPRVDRFKPGGNIITIAHPNWSSKYYLTGSKAASYPIETVRGKTASYSVYAIPLSELQTVGEHAAEQIEIVKAIRQIGWWQ